MTELSCVSIVAIAYPTREATKTNEKPVIDPRPIIISFIFLLHAEAELQIHDHEP